MKKVEAIIRPEMLNEAKEALTQIGVRGMTVSEVMGCGNQKGHKRVYRGMEVGVNLLHKVKIEIVTEDDYADCVAETIAETCCTGEFGDGKIFICPVEKVIRIRTGEYDEKAL